MIEDSEYTARQGAKFPIKWLVFFSNSLCILLFSFQLLINLLLSPQDRSGGRTIRQVHNQERCLELRNTLVRADHVRSGAILGHAESRGDRAGRARLPDAKADEQRMPGHGVRADAALLGAGSGEEANVRVHIRLFRRFLCQRREQLSRRELVDWLVRCKFRKEKVFSHSHAPLSNPVQTLYWMQKPPFSVLLDAFYFTLFSLLVQNF